MINSRSLVIFCLFFALLSINPSLSTVFEEADQSDPKFAKSQAGQKNLDLQSLLKKFNQTAHPDKGEHDFEKPLTDKNKIWKDGKDIIILESY